MKKLLFLFLCSSLFSIKAQSDEPYPDSYLDVGLGVGPNYGIYGVQAVLGYKGNGLLIAGGAFDGIPTRQIGLQLSYRWLFASIGYGVYGSSYNSTTRTTKPLEGTILMAGVKLNLIKSKKLFFELGYGYTTGAVVVTPVGSYSVEGPALVAGIGYRLVFN